MHSPPDSITSTWTSVFEQKRFVKHIRETLPSSSPTRLLSVMADNSFPGRAPPAAHPPNRVCVVTSSESQAHKDFIRVLTDRLERNQAFWICLNDFKGGTKRLWFFMIYGFPLWLQFDAFAFQYLPAFMASSCVQRCGSSNKEPFNFAHISIKRKEKREERAETLPSNCVRPHMCVLGMMGFTSSISRALTNTRRGDIDILLLLIYLWFSWRLSAAANNVASCVSCKKRVFRTAASSCHKCHIGLLSKQRRGLETTTS